MEQTKLAMLTEKARAIRIGAVEAVYSASSGHPGGSLSIADIVAYLYFAEMNVDPADPKKADRDRFVLSKGHTAPALYAALAEKGYFAKENLKTLRQVDSFLQGHPDMKHTPGVDMSSGPIIYCIGSFFCKRRIISAKTLRCFSENSLSLPP